MTTHSRKLTRSVSIIGVGSTPYGSLLTHPKLQNLCEEELFAWAALNAMEDAGIEGKEIEALFHGQLGNIAFSRMMSPAAAYQDWCGMHGTPGIHHEEACGTGYVGFNLAVMAVASGAYDFVLTGGVEVLSCRSNSRRPAHMKEDAPIDFKIGEIAHILADPAFSRFPSNVVHDSLFGYPPADYCRKYGLTWEQFDDTCNALALHCRRGAVRHPLAAQQREFKDIAREAGFDDPMDLLRDTTYNPIGSDHYRKFHNITNVDGASAVIVCPTELAHKFKQQPVEVLGISASSMDTRHPRNESKITEIVCQQVYQNTGVTPKEIDFFMSQDLKIFDQIESAEIAGYLPRGEGWRMAIEGQTAFDGDRPINTNGGRPSFGHAYGASGLADIQEAVQQMRGQAGDRQVKKLPETAMIRGVGGGQNATAAILRTVQ